VEIGLKAVIAGEFQSETLPDRRFVAKIFVHTINELSGLAGLTAELQNRRQSDPRFDSNWAVVANWSEEIRYEDVDSIRANAMLNAILHRRSGVLPWLRTFW
jgi:hypothetical protein